MTEQFQLDPTTSAVLMMDFQNVLVENYVPEAERAEVLANAASTLQAARAARVSVIHVMVAFRRGHPEVNDRS